MLGMGLGETLLSRKGRVGCLITIFGIAGIDFVIARKFSLGLEGALHLMAFDMTLAGDGTENFKSFYSNGLMFMPGIYLKYLF